MASQTRPNSQKHHPSEQKPANLVCGFCGLMVESAASLRVHIHFNHESAGRWNSAPSPTSSTSMRLTSPTEGASVSPTDSENNNQPFKRQKTPNSGGSPTDDKAPQQNPVAAAADSSDNKPPSPLHQICSTTAFDEATSRAYAHHQQASSYYGHHPFLAPPPTYEAGYGLLGNNYDSMQQQQQQLMQPRQQHEYKPVPSHRYHPYHQQTINNHNPPSPTPQQHHHIASTSSTAPTPLSDTIINSTSVRMHQMGSEGDHQMVSPKQCDKCGFVCDTVSVLSEHCATQHGGSSEAQDTEGMAFSLGGNQHSYIKEETTSDILDLDSQKVVYPQHHHEGVLASDTTALPPMHSLHPLQSMQRHPIMWHEPQSSYMSQQQTLKPQFFPSMKAPYITPVLGPAKSDYGATVVGNIKSEYMSQTMLPPPDVKMFADSSNNQVSTSQSDFPTTTTPQDSDAAYRTQFEPASSSLPSGQQTKSASWKSNEARRPKTYNCTACNKWFTSSGHLKRHYNTTLHKNAVKSSGQPDPATLPISVHHHPARDNVKNNHHLSSVTDPPQPVIPPPVSSAMDANDAEFGGATQYSTGGDFRGGLLGQVTPTESNSVYQAQQFCPNPPNGEAGPSAPHASQPRGLLTHMPNITLLASHQEVLPPIPTTTTIIHPIIHPSISQGIISSMVEPPPPYIRQATPPMVQSLHTTQSHLVDPPANCPTIIGDHGIVDPREAYGSLAAYETATSFIETPITRFTSQNIGDTVPPFSPDMPDHVAHVRSLTPKMAATAPLVSPSSPSVTSSARQGKPKRTYRSTKKNGIGAHGEPLRCNECDKVFNKACYLTQHNKTFHSGEKPFKCHRCGKRFPCDQTHEEHVVKHSGEKPHKCDQCPKQFNHKTDLRRHLCLHTGYKPYTCDLCSKGFIRKDHLMKHKEVHMKKAAGGKNKQQQTQGKNTNKKANISSVPNSSNPNDVLHI